MALLGCGVTPWVARSSVLACTPALLASSTCPPSAQPEHLPNYSFHSSLSSAAPVISREERCAWSDGGAISILGSGSHTASLPPSCRGSHATSFQLQFPGIQGWRLQQVRVLPLLPQNQNVVLGSCMVQRDSCPLALLGITVLGRGDGAAGPMPYVAPCMWPCSLVL